MKIFNHKLGKKDAFLRFYLHANLSRIGYSGMSFPEKRRAVLIIPGGGYNHISEREAEPVAISFFEKGYECAVLYYSVGEDMAHSNPIEEAAEAVSVLRRLESVDEKKITAIGFSAGGHLAAMLAEHGCEFSNDAELNALILAYPVITMGKYTHRGSHDLIVSVLSNEDYLSAEMNVSSSFPPTYIWATRTDETVDVRNSLMMYEAVIEKGIYSELHIYPEGSHGLSLATVETGRCLPYVTSWLDDASRFLDSVF